jgi:hypothetical protein
MATSFADILSLAPKATPRNTFTNVALDNAAKYGELLKWNQEALLSAAVQKQDADLKEKGLQLREKEIDALSDASGGSTRKNSKALALAAFLPAIMEGFTGGGRKEDNRRMAGQLYGNLLQGQGNSLEGFDSTLGVLNSIHEKIGAWNRRVPAAFESIPGRTGQS